MERSLIGRSDHGSHYRSSAIKRGRFVGHHGRSARICGNLRSRADPETHTDRGAIVPHATRPGRSVHWDTYMPGANAKLAGRELALDGCMDGFWVFCLHGIWQAVQRPALDSALGNTPIPVFSRPPTDEGGRRAESARYPTPSRAVASA